LNSFYSIFAFENILLGAKFGIKIIVNAIIIFILIHILLR